MVEGGFSRNCLSLISKARFSLGEAGQGWVDTPLAPALAPEWKRDSVDWSSGPRPSDTSLCTLIRELTVLSHPCPVSCTLLLAGSPLHSWSRLRQQGWVGVGRVTLRLLSPPSPPSPSCPESQPETQLGPHTRMCRLHGQLLLVSFGHEKLFWTLCQPVPGTLTYAFSFTPCNRPASHYICCVGKKTKAQKDLFACPRPHSRTLLMVPLSTSCGTRHCAKGFALQRWVLF